MFANLPPVTRALLVANVLAFGLQAMAGELAMLDFMLWPLGRFGLGMAGGLPVTAGFEPWQLVSYGFLHGGLAHLAFNMLALVMFGAGIEHALGPRRFALYYFTTVIGAGLVQLLVATMAVQQGEPPYPTVGASGGVFGVLLAYGLLFPNHRVMLLIPPIPMRAITLVVVYGALELALGIFARNSGVAHFAHLGGMLFGFGLLQYWRRRWPFAGPRRR